MIESLIDTFGDNATLGLAGLLVGILFGIAAQRSHFCLRAATVEVAEGTFGARLAVWLVAFAAALAGVQGAAALDLLQVEETRALSATGSVSGAVIGGALFGIGMILARGCASRLLVLAASGNLRALVTGLVVTLVAQASYRGALSPLREDLASLWTIPGGASRNIGAWIGAGHGVVAFVAFALLLASFVFARSRGVGMAKAVAAAFVGLAVTLGWLATYTIAQNSFEIVPVASITFTGPATDTLMALVTATSVPLSFGIGLVPGVAIGAAGSAFQSREWRIERFGPDTPMERYLVGAVFMGFGAMLAGGCAVGAGLSGGSVLSATAWLAVFSMWVSAMFTHRLFLVLTPQVAS